MYKSSFVDHADWAAFAARAGASSGRLRWLISRETCNSPAAKVGLMELSPGARIDLGTESGAEQIVVVLGGSGTFTTPAGDAEAAFGSALYLPAGSSSTLRVGDRTLRAIVVHAGSPAENDYLDRVTGAGSPAVVNVADFEEMAVHEPALGLFHVHGLWAISDQSLGSRNIVLSQGRFPPGGSHELHAHRNADEWVYVYEGEGLHLMEGAEVKQKAGEMIFIPRNEWHGLKTSGEHTTRIFSGYIGANTVEKTGYVLYGADNLSDGEVSARIRKSTGL
jgi:quercetin dioxygenase-like cupin family protein